MMWLKFCFEGIIFLPNHPGEAGKTGDFFGKAIF